MGAFQRSIARRSRENGKAERVPYTVSHIAAVMPGYKLLSRAHVFSAAVIGSMVPDFGLLLPREPLRYETHSLSALVTFCLPVGLIAYWLTQLLIKPAVLEILPDKAYLRLYSSHPSASLAHVRTWFTVSAGLLLGALTHLVWDAFTHEEARGVRAFPLLTDYSPALKGHSLRLYAWLQFGSSVFGLAIVIAAIALWLRHTPPLSAPLVRRMRLSERRLWLSLYLVPPGVAVGWAIWRGLTAGTTFESSIGLSGLAIASIRGAVVSLVFISGMLRIRLASG